MHVVGKLVKQLGPGQQIFRNISAADALRELRTLLARCGVQDADKFNTRDIRRGHAQDLADAGSLSTPFHI